MITINKVKEGLVNNVFDAVCDTMDEVRHITEMHKVIGTDMITEVKNHDVTVKYVVRYKKKKVNYF